MESIGGQAIIEGVMLRRKSTYSIAVRKPNKQIHVIKRNIKDNRKGLMSIFKLPFFRGMYAMYEMFSIGMNSLIYSSNIALEDEEEKLSSGNILSIVVFSLLIVIAFFIILPYFLTLLTGIQEKSNPIMFNIVDSIIKFLFFLGYVIAISRMKDIKRIFQYHGAEHKTVHCYEHNLDLTVANVKKFSTKHPRCGSSFIMWVLMVSIVLFSFLPMLVSMIIPSLYSLNVIAQKSILILSRILLIPIIIGISYEILKLAGKFSSNVVFQVINSPGMFLQKLTTGEPDSKQIEVAIAAMKKLI
jgi:uncharacterized protein YqhQ